MLPPNWVKGGTERVQRFFFTIPVRTLWGAASRPLLYILGQYCDPPAAIYGWPLKCTLQHSGFGTANCNNFYNPRTSLDVTPTPTPSYPTATLTHLGEEMEESADLIRSVYHICFRPRSPQIEKRGITEFLLNYEARAAPPAVSRFNSCSFHLMTIDQP